MKKWKLIKKILYIIFIVTCSTLFIGSIFIRKIYPDVLFDELYFYLTNGVANSDNSLIIMGLKYCLPLIVFLSVIIYILLHNLYLSNYILKKIIEKKYLKIIQVILSIILFLVSILIVMYNLNIFEYIKNQKEVSNFIELNYIYPESADIEFPDKKRNLITIIVESLETSMFTKKQGGYWNYDVVPELYKLLNDKDAVVFYNNNKAELMEQLDKSAWTTAGDVANTSGLPLKIPVQRSSYHSKNFMSGAYSIGDMLKDNGYYNEYISSARTSFGGIKEYFYNHGDYKIVDINSYKSFNISLEQKDFSEWGFNDYAMFEIAKKRLKELSLDNRPFNLTLQTIDTHYVDGYIEWYSKDEYDTQYENVYATESMLIYNFIKWLKKQDFYDNTTIMIVGDHISMQADYFEARGANKRYIYNCYINPVKKAINTNNRVYTSVDSYPTLLSSIGVNIKGNKLGLGVDLFSNEKTLSEKYGFDYVNNELNKKSIFYNKVILGRDYDIMSGEVNKNGSKK